MAWAFLTGFGALIYFVYRFQLNAKSLCVSLLIFGAGLLYSSTLGIFQERLHLVEYGILGLILFSANKGRGIGIAFFLTLTLGCVAASLDETLQWILPYRVGDFRDVLFDLIGVAWGATLRWSSSLR